MFGTGLVVFVNQNSLKRGCVSFNQVVSLVILSRSGFSHGLTQVLAPKIISPTPSPRFSPTTSGCCSFLLPSPC